MTMVSKPVVAGEPDLLVGNESKALRFESLVEGKLLASHEAPDGGWTHEALERVAAAMDSTTAWNAFLDEDWVGSSEV